MDRRILLVDDEPFNLLSVKVLLKTITRQLGIDPNIIEENLDSVTDGIEAIEAVIRLDEVFNMHYSLIITDLQMPRLDGYQTSRQIRAYYESKNIKQPVIIACTGHIEQKYIEKAWQHEINEVISKPLNINVVQEIIKEFFK
jgi:CheY-like chemotaxis protein